MNKINIKAIEIWFDGLFWCIWAILMYAQLRIAGNDITDTLVYIAIPLIFYKFKDD